MAQDDFRQALIRATGEDCVLSAEADRFCYSYDAAGQPPVLPELVICPDHAEQIGHILALCQAYDRPVTVRGAGTNLSGGTVPSARTGVVLSTQRLNRILEIDEADLLAVVEPGVITVDFAAEVAGRGLFYPPDPGSQAVSTLGGNVAENAGGLRGLKYGVTQDYLLGLEFYDIYGDLIKTGARTVKCVTGYNLGSLLCGSEGTLGVISRITLKLVPPPRASRALIALFDDVRKASEAVAGIIARHVIPCTLEYLDRATHALTDDYSPTGLPRDAEAILLIEVDGHPAQVGDDAAAVEEELRRAGGDIRVARDAAEKDRIWTARRNALPALARARPTTLLEDATVPRSKVPDMVEAIAKVAATHQVRIATFGNAGDGNLHPTFLYDRRDQAESARVAAAVDDIFRAALDLGGTLSGEHGIGTAKAAWLENETGRGHLLYSRRLRKGVDPKGLLNPDKLVGVRG